MTYREPISDRVFATLAGVLLAVLVIGLAGWVIYVTARHGEQDREIRCLKAGGELVDGFCWRQMDGGTK